MVEENKDNSEEREKEEPQAMHKEDVSKRSHSRFVIRISLQHLKTRNQCGKEGTHKDARNKLV